jgi:hypothetical protein
LEQGNHGVGAVSGGAGGEDEAGRGAAVRDWSQSVGGTAGVLAQKLGSIQSEVTQLREAVQSLVNRFDARDHIDDMSPYFRNYKIDVSITRVIGKYKAETKINWGDGEVVSAVNDRPDWALQDLVKSLSAKRVFVRDHKLGFPKEETLS